MTTFSRAARMAILIGAVGLTASGCTQLKGRQGYIGDPTLMQSVQIGVDNRESVEKTLGRPTFVGQFGSDEWYYFSRSTRALAFASPRPTAQDVLRVRFDAAGNVAAVDRIGMESIARLSPESDKTPTLGRERTFFEDIFGNIGAVGAPGMGGGGGGDTP